MEDVTKSVLAGVTDAMTESERASFVNKAIERIKGNVEGNYEIEIKPFYEGNEYYMFLYEIYRRSEEHTSELQSRENLVCRLLLEKKKTDTQTRCASQR